MMPHPLEPSLVFVLGGETPVGMGFLVAADRICTCAHVVCDALGWPHEREQPDPGAQLELKFVFLNKQEVIRSVIDVWIPYSSTKGDGDIAVLKLLSPAPDRASPIQTFATWAPQLILDSYGCPDQAEGEWATVKAVKATRYLVQLERAVPTGAYIKPGYSGSPLWDPDANAVVGMVAQFKDEHSVQLGYMLPWETISPACQFGADGGTVLGPSGTTPDDASPSSSLRYDPKLYVSRPKTERKIRDLLRSHSMISLWGPAHSGKSWLLRHIIEEYTVQERCQCIYIDCQRYHLSTYPGLIKSLAQQVLTFIEKQKPDLLALANNVYDSKWENNRIQPLDKLYGFLEQTILAPNVAEWRGKYAVLLLDHMERMETQTFQRLQENLRALLNEEPNLPLRIVLSSSLLMDGDPSIHMASPAHAMATTIYLEPFDESQVQQLLARSGLPTSQEELMEICEWSGGSAGLLHLLMSGRGAKAPSAWLRDDAEAAIEQHLKASIEWPLLKDAQTLTALCGLLHNPNVALEPIQRTRLESAGIIKNTDTGYRIGCKAYRNFIQGLCTNKRR